MKKKKELDPTEQAYQMVEDLHQHARENNITQEQIAEKTGFLSNNVNRMLTGKYMPKLDNFIRLAQAVGKKIEVKDK